jgi:hypothetical protein
VQPHTVEIVDALGGLAFTVAGFEVTRPIVFFFFLGTYLILIILSSLLVGRRYCSPGRTRANASPVSRRE